MATKEKDRLNPVAKLREKFLEKKKNRSPSQEIKDTLKKKNDEVQKDDSNKKVARPRPPRNEADL